MNNNIHVLPVTKKPALRGRAPALPRAAVLQMAEHLHRNVDTPEKPAPDATATAIEKLAYHLLMAVRAAKAISNDFPR